MNKKQIFFRLCLILLALIFVSCSSSTQSSHKKAISSNITIAFTSWPGFDISYYAKIKGLFDHYDLNVTLKKYSDQESAAKALQNQEVDAAMISIFDATHLQGDNLFNLLLVTNISAGADGIVSNISIKSLKELKGKRISAQKNTVNELILLEALEFANMSFNDITVVDITNKEALPQLFHNKIDAAVLWEPLLTKTKIKLRGNILFNTKEVNSSVIDLLVVQNKSFTIKKEAWGKFIFAWFDLMNEVQNNREKVMQVVSRKISNPHFTEDYSGLRAGTISLNQEIFFNKKLEKTISKINSFTKVENQAKLVVQTDFMKQHIIQWKEIHIVE